MVRNGKPKKNRLRVRRVVDVPLCEVSGICSRRSANGRMSLIAVGDAEAKIAWSSLSRGNGSEFDWHKKSIAKLSGSELPKHDPQIEAVCADGIGRILLLQENPQRAELIDLKSLETVALIDLVVEGRDKIARAWRDPKGSRAKERYSCPVGICSLPRRRNRRCSLSSARHIRGRGGWCAAARWRTASDGQSEKAAIGSLLSQSGFPTRH